MKRPTPNHWPREGQHNPVTRDGVSSFERARRDHTVELDYTIGGTVETQVHASVEAARQYAVNRGHRILQHVSNDLGDNAQQALRKPLAVDFDLVRKEAEQHRATRSQSHIQDRDVTP
ncbi:hypothetical protein JANAI62_37810 [Jannaschia pagri]|uniref:MobA/MobL family protein n=1 Tax=Jannaschia pagri TaxID=2829797 RepID=A0ABQ4NS12_9RHOB|nr:MULTISPECIES: hypothetical protein [unclassified Jannaschia]GIT93357.1 hypothetical protein JANAI61_38150 [Jannaschia sp. AI_61]GIT97158.1 hypothetical protein JANAI62_37810 [Jannaschia sp. AI_62]